MAGLLATCTDCTVHPDAAVFVKNDLIREALWF